MGLKGALMRMIKRKMSAAWEKWQQTYADLKFETRALGGAIRRMLNRKLSMAWEKWQFTAAEMARQQFLLKGALMRMIKRKMSAAWEKWQQVYADQKFAMQMGGGAIRRMMNRKLSKTWPPLRRITKRLAWTPTRLKTQPMTVNIRSRSWFETTTCCQKTTLKTGFLSFYVFYPYYPYYDKCVKPKNKIRSYSAFQYLRTIFLYLL